MGSSFTVYDICNQSRPGYQHHFNITVLAQYCQPSYHQKQGVLYTLNTQEWALIRVEGLKHATQVNIAQSEGVAQIIHSTLMTVHAYGLANIDSCGYPERLTGMDTLTVVCGLCSYMVLLYL